MFCQNGYINLFWWSLSGFRKKTTFLIAHLVFHLQEPHWWWYENVWKCFLLRLLWPLFSSPSREGSDNSNLALFSKSTQLVCPSFCVTIDAAAINPRRYFVYRVAWIVRGKPCFRIIVARSIVRNTLLEDKHCFEYVSQTGSSFLFLLCAPQGRIYQMRGPRA